MSAHMNRRVRASGQSSGTHRQTADVTPDVRRDILVYEFAAVDALTGANVGARWSIWIGAETAGTFDSEAEALAHAAELTRESGRPAWIIRDGAERRTPLP